MSEARPALRQRLGQLASRERYLHLAALVVVGILIITILIFRDRLLDVDVRNAAYGGIFVLTLIGSASVLIPVPGILAVYWGGHDLNPVLVGLLAGGAEGIGELSGYLLGFGGSGVVERRWWYARVEWWMRRRGSLLVFLMSAVPNPLFDVVGLAAGSLRFPVWRFLVATWLGKTVKNLMVAFAGAQSVPLLLRLLERWFS